jgi:hypothetical protein
MGLYSTLFCAILADGAEVLDSSSECSLVREWAIICKRYLRKTRLVVYRVSKRDITYLFTYASGMESCLLFVLYCIKEGSFARGKSMGTHGGRVWREPVMEV